MKLRYLALLVIAVIIGPSGTALNASPLGGTVFRDDFLLFDGWEYKGESLATTRTNHGGEFRVAGGFLEVASYGSSDYPTTYSGPIAERPLGSAITPGEEFRLEVGLAVAGGGYGEVVVSLVDAAGLRVASIIWGSSCGSGGRLHFAHEEGTFELATYCGGEYGTVAGPATLARSGCNWTGTYGGQTWSAKTCPTRTAVAVEIVMTNVYPPGPWATTRIDSITTTSSIDEPCAIEKETDPNTAIVVDTDSPNVIEFADTPDSHGTASCAAAASASQTAGPCSGTVEAYVSARGAWDTAGAPSAEAPTPHAHETATCG